MKIKNSFFLLLAICHLITLPSLAQGDIPVGSWRYHNAYTDVEALTGSNTSVFALSDNALFYFSVSDFQPKTLTKLDGLYGQDFNQMAFDPQTKTLVLAYPDGTVDLVGENNIRTLREIRDNSELEDKTIHQIKINDHSAWLATAFGLVWINLDQGRIQDAYLNLGPNGTPLPIWDLAVQGQRLWVTTPQGVFQANQSTNLKDFRNWQHFSDQPSFQSFQTIAHSLFALSIDGEIFRLENNQWEAIWGISEVNTWKTISNTLYFSTPSGIFQLDPEGSFEELISLASSPQDFHWAGNQLFLTTEKEGVLRYETEEVILPSGPLAAVQAFGIPAGQVMALPNRINRNGQLISSSHQQSSLFAEGQWEKAPSPGQVTATANQSGKQFFGTAENGLWKLQEGELISLNFPEIPSSARISDMVPDHLGNIWIAASNISSKVFKLSPEENLKEVVIPGLISPLKIQVDRAGNLWILQGNNSGSNLRVFHQEKEMNRLITTSENQGRLPSPRVLDFHLALSGQLWLGTENGVAVIPQPSTVQTNTAINAILPLHENRPLLQGQSIASLQIAPDGSQWLGTQRDGLWHFSEDNEPLHHFQKSNSPLPDDGIQQLRLDLRSGELFILTSQGALSYRGGSIREAESLSNLKIYPNPVRPNFSGLLSIEGLIDDATLKITNTIGRVMFLKQVLGGKTTWNLRDHGGRKVAPGVYMVYVVDKNGIEKIAGKFLVL